MSEISFWRAAGITQIDILEEPMVSNPSQVFDSVFISIYEQHSEESKDLFYYIQRLLYQFRLSNAYEPKDILVEVYTRGIRALNKGTTITNPQGWIRRVALHVIQEFRRAADKINYSDLDDEPYLASVNSNCLSQLVFQNDLKTIRLAFEKLSLADQKLLEYRIIEGLSWRQIQIKLEQAEEDKTDADTLRVRGHRALKRLKDIYNEMRDKIKIDDL